MTTTLSVTVPGNPNSYELHIGNGAVSKLTELASLKTATKVLVFFDAGLGEPIRQKLANVLPSCPVVYSAVPSGERSKGPEQLIRLWQELLHAEADRRSVVINCGGGMIGDLGGFAAATYMRGIPFIQIPTTLLSQVDASIGGKVAINLDGIKNLVGSITAPSGVIIDLDFLDTLPEREFRSGFAEIIKHGLIRDSNFAETVLSADAKSWNKEELKQIVIRSCGIKRDVVQADPLELGERKILNFGHTVGHALESLSHRDGAPLLHGEAVSIGMIIESAIAERAGLLSRGDLVRVSEGLARAGLVMKVPNKFSLPDIKSILSRDKKNAGTSVRWSLISAIGKASFDQIVPDHIVDEVLKETCGD